VCRDGYWNACEVDPVIEACTNDCGEGERTCAGGQWGECRVPPAERACSNPCGTGTEQCVDGQWGECLVPPVERPCFSACGDGVERCEQGVWAPCDAPKPEPPTLTATVRDFSESHPDFEEDSSGDDPGIVESALSPDDKPVYAGNPTTLTTSGKAAFDQWFRDAPAVNATTQTRLQFSAVSGTDGLFRYSSSAFFPIDGQLLGNEGREHNYHFTLEIATEFRYVGGETFRFSGDDDVWVFINRQLAIDLGGRHPREEATVRLDDRRDRFGIAVGGTYALHVFFAERHTVSSDFEVETEIGTEPSCP
jgi:fibro-slime domain-containing protein